MKKHFLFLGLLTGTCIALSGCYNFSRLHDIGDVPPLTRTQDPTAYEGYQPVLTPMPTPIVEKHERSSLWQPGARAFFKDQRANRIGDILTVIVNIDEKAKIKNNTSYGRSEDQQTAFPNVYGLEKLVSGIIDPSKAVSLKSSPSHKGTGSIDRQEQVNLNVATLVTQVLPNGNLVISGRQEMRFNFEVREIILSGVVRPEDILANNTIVSEKIAELRVSYGGRGQLSDVQEAPYGQQILNRITPF